MHPRRLWSFALDGEAELPPTPPRKMVTPVDDANFQIDRGLAAHGRYVWSKTCF